MAFCRSHSDGRRMEPRSLMDDGVMAFHRSYVRQHWKEPQLPSDDGVKAFSEAMAMGDGESYGRQQTMESWHFAEAMTMEG